MTISPNSISFESTPQLPTRIICFISRFFSSATAISTAAGPMPDDKADMGAPLYSPL